MTSATIEVSDKSTRAVSRGLSLRGITKSYGANRVLEGISLDVKPRECVAVIGENGAGKSTLSSIIAGVVRPSSGHMFWNGEPYSPASPSDSLALGIGMIHQEIRLIPYLSAAENVFLGRLPTRRGVLDRGKMTQLASAQLQRLGSNISPNAKVASLKIAAQQQIEIAKALSLDAKMLIFDEPTAALGMAETDRLFSQIRRLKSAGLATIYISHRLEEIVRIADRIVVLRDGTLVSSYPTANVPTDVIVTDMVGRKIDRLFPDVPKPTEHVVLEVKDIAAPDGAFRGITFNVSRGEIFGIAGLVGAGRTELVRAIAGADKLRSGEVYCEGARVDRGGPADARRAGIFMVPEDRKSQGLLLDRTVEENVAIGNFDLIARRGWIPSRNVRRFAQNAIESVGVKGGATQIARRLSGGNQQKLLIAKWLARSPTVFILDEPTRGVDVGARSQIYDTIAKVAKSGKAVIVVSSDLDEVVGLSHRILVLTRGINRGILSRAEATHEAVMRLATTSSGELNGPLPPGPLD